MRRQDGIHEKMPGESMDAQSIEQEYVTVTDIAQESGQKLATVYNWLRYHHYLSYERVLGRTVVRRAEWDEFKRTHTGLMKRGARQKSEG